MSETTLLDRPAAKAATSAAAPVLGFERTPAGQSQLQQPSMALSPQAIRLLMLFEEPQTIDGLRQIIDEAWLPEALIELERRKLIRRIHILQQDPAIPAITARALAEVPRRTPEREASVRLARQRAQARILFLQQIGRLSTLMIDRIEACQSEAELQRLTPAFAELLPPAPVPTLMEQAGYHYNRNSH